MSVSPVIPLQFVKQEGICYNETEKTGNLSRLRMCRGAGERG